MVSLNLWQFGSSKHVSLQIVWRHSASTSGGGSGSSCVTLILISGITFGWTSMSDFGSGVNSAVTLESGLTEKRNIKHYFWRSVTSKTSKINFRMKISIDTLRRQDFLYLLIYDI
jgi:hypothetical protein